MNSQKIKNIMRKKFRKSKYIKNKESQQYLSYKHVNNYDLIRIGVQLSLNHKYFKMNKYDLIMYFQGFLMNYKSDSMDFPFNGLDLNCNPPDQNLKNEYFSYDESMNYGKFNPDLGDYERNNKKRNHSIKFKKESYYLRINFHLNEPFSRNGIGIFCQKIFINKLKALNGDPITLNEMSEEEKLAEKMAIIYMREYTKIIKHMKEYHVKMKTEGKYDQKENQKIYKEMCNKFKSEKLYKNKDLIDSLVYDEKIIHEEFFDFTCW